MKGAVVYTRKIKKEGYVLIVLGFQIRLNAGKKEDPEFSKMCEDFMAERDE